MQFFLKEISSNPVFSSLFDPSTLAILCTELRESVDMVRLKCSIYTWHKFIRDTILANLYAGSSVQAGIANTYADFSGYMDDVYALVKSMCSDSDLPQVSACIIELTLNGLALKICALIRQLQAQGNKYRDILHGDLSTLSVQAGRYSGQSISTGHRYSLLHSLIALVSQRVEDMGRGIFDTPLGRLMRALRDSDSKWR